MTSGNREELPLLVKCHTPCSLLHVCLQNDVVFPIQSESLQTLSGGRPFVFTAKSNGLWERNPAPRTAANHSGRELFAHLWWGAEMWLSWWSACLPSLKLWVPYQELHKTGVAYVSDSNTLEVEAGGLESYPQVHSMFKTNWVT